MDEAQTKAQHAIMLLTGKELQSENGVIEFWFLPYEGLHREDDLNGSNLIIVEKPEKISLGWYIIGTKGNTTEVHISLAGVNYQLLSVGRKDKQSPFILTLLDRDGKQTELKQTERQADLTYLG